MVTCYLKFTYVLGQYVFCILHYENTEAKHFNAFKIILSLSLSSIVSKGLVLTNFAWEEKLDKNQEKEHFMKFYIHL